VSAIAAVALQIDRFGPWDFELDAGLYVLLAPEATLGALCSALAGDRPPRRGALHVAGGRPSREPALRRRIVALRSDESLPPAPTVARALTLAARARGLDRHGADLLESVGLGAWAERRPDVLDAGERRSAQLALGWAVKEPALVVLTRPSGELPGFDARVRSELEDRAARCPVLLLEADEAAALAHGAPVWIFERGRLAPLPVAARDDAACLRVGVADPARFAGVVPAQVRSVEPGAVLLAGAPLAELAQVVADTALALDLDVESVSVVPAGRP
jgi:ABC-type uncharacterized transport system YnjBCD ATPase subunit